jgi:Xaa-Pro aminopeptidase
MGTDPYALATPFGTGASDWQAGINYERMRKERLERAQAALKRHNIAAAILWRMENMRYAIAVRGHVFVPGLSYALVFAEHDPILYETGTMIEQQRMYCPWLKPDNIRLAYCWLDSVCGPEAAQDEGKKFANAIVRDLKANGVFGQRIGVDALDEVGRAALRELGVALVNAQPAFLEARRCKTPDEVACMETAVAISNAGYMRFVETFKPGMRERDGGAAIFDAMMRAGAEAVAGGPRTKYNSFDVYHESNTDRIVDPGDLATVNLCSTRFAGYRVCVYRSFIVGRKPNQKERGWYKRCHDRVYGIIAAIKPGATTADAAKALLPSNSWGYQDEESLLVAEVGHGIGMSYEEPVISRVWSFDHPQTFEPGMIIAVECREGEYGYGGVRLEEMVLVTEKGNRILTTWPADEIMPVACL